MDCLKLTAAGALCGPVIVFLLYFVTGEQMDLVFNRGLPYLLIAGPLGALVAFVVWAVWAIDRRLFPVASTLCRTCGYDLRATPDRCPECGASKEFER